MEWTALECMLEDPHYVNRVWPVDHFTQVCNDAPCHIPEWGRWKHHYVPVFSRRGGGNTIMSVLSPIRSYSTWHRLVPIELPGVQYLIHHPPPPPPPLTLIFFFHQVATVSSGSHAYPYTYSTTEPMPTIHLSGGIRVWWACAACKGNQ
jgi:hypothetical protein